MTDHTSRRRQIASSARDRLRKIYQNACAICGIGGDEVPLEVCHIVPIPLGGDSSDANLTILCPNCNMSGGGQLRGLEFESILADLLSRNPNFRNVRREVIFIGRDAVHSADIVASRVRPGGIEPLLIECKAAPVRSERLKGIASQLRKYQGLYGKCQPVLAVAGTMAEQDLTLLEREEIELWDLKYMAREFADQIEGLGPSYFKMMLVSQLCREDRPSIEQELIAKLRSTAKGKKDAAVYQKTVGDILELLFCPPLTKPISERPDKTRANRRDIILPNYADSGFWRSIREQYCADYVIVDAKNYSNKVKKNDVLQLANYLKPRGAGLFGLIVSRNGGDSAGCEVTVREQWFAHGKLILVLADDDLEFMLRAKGDRQPPEDVIGRKIEEFRLSI